MNLIQILYESKLSQTEDSFDYDQAELHADGEFSHNVPHLT